MAFFFTASTIFAWMTYLQTIDYLFSQLPMFSRIGSAAYKKDLTNTIELCQFLGNPHQQFKTIHIAGTNGKGSVSHMLASILQTAGYKTGLYTSPHLKDFRERIKINGEMIPEQSVIDFTEKIKPKIEKISPSFFEITVAMAFNFFAEQEVDIAVIETGLGGRLDSTNIITPELSIITNIGWDHMNMLGDTIEKIAIEKAGIIKPGVPVIIGEKKPATTTIFNRISKERKSPIFFASEKRQAANWKWEHHELVVEIEEEHHTNHKKYRLDLPGIYQTKNLLSVLEACSQLFQKGWKINDEIISKALQKTKKLTGLHGRWEIIHNNPMVVLDVAHNEDGIQQLIQQIELTEHHQLHIITGMVKDKDVEKVLLLLPKEAIYYFTKAQIPRALSETELAEKGRYACLKGKTFADVNIALKEAMLKSKPEDMILVCGSIFLVGEVKISKLPASPMHT